MTCGAAVVVSVLALTALWFVARAKASRSEVEWLRQEINNARAPRAVDDPHGDHAPETHAREYVTVDQLLAREQHACSEHSQTQPLAAVPVPAARSTPTNRRRGRA